jgi:hypothetical protein
MNRAVMDLRAKAVSAVAVTADRGVKVDRVVVVAVDGTVALAVRAAVIAGLAVKVEIAHVRTDQQPEANIAPKVRHTPARKANRIVTATADVIAISKAAKAKSHVRAKAADRAEIARSKVKIRGTVETARVRKDRVEVNSVLETARAVRREINRSKLAPGIARVLFRACRSLRP